MQPTPLADVPYPGEKVTFGDLIIRFLIQEDMTNYKELYNWLIGLGSPEKSEQYTNFVDKQKYRTPLGSGSVKDKSGSTGAGE